MSRYCPNCSQPLDYQHDTKRDGQPWCPNCRAPVKGALRSIPAWILGVVVIVLIVWQFGLL
jgi:hypothetical protein